MRTAGIIPVDPLGDCSSCFLKTGEIVLPNAFFLQAPKEAFNDSVLFWRVRRNELLRKFIVTACFTETLALENKAVITLFGRNVPKRLMQAFSRARSASLARPRRANSKPISSRSQQSMTATRCPHPSIPHWICVMSVRGAPQNLDKCDSLNLS